MVFPPSHNIRGFLTLESKLKYTRKSWHILFLVSYHVPGEDEREDGEDASIGNRYTMQYVDVDDAIMILPRRFLALGSKLEYTRKSWRIWFLVSCHVPGEDEQEDGEDALALAFGSRPLLTAAAAAADGRAGDNLHRQRQHRRHQAAGHRPRPVAAVITVASRSHRLDERTRTRLRRAGTHRDRRSRKRSRRVVHTTATKIAPMTLDKTVSTARTPAATTRPFLFFPIFELITTLD